MKVTEIRQLVEADRLEDAIKAMLQAAQSTDNDLYNSIIQLSGRYRNNERQNMRGLVSASEYNRSRAQITYALLEYINELPDNISFAAPPDVKPIVGGNDQPAPTPAPTPAPDSDITKILLLASNPTGTGQLQQSKEHSRISREMQNSPNPDLFRVKFKEAVTLSEFQQFIVLERPNIVHFSGHGEKGNAEVEAMIENTRAGRKSDEVNEDDSGIILYDEDKRNSFFVSTDVIEHLFETMVEDEEVPINIVFFNSCHSVEQANAISKIVPYVVGTSWSVTDKAAIAFAKEFYFGIAQKKKVKSAFNMGITAALALKEPKNRFVLYKDGKKIK